MKCLIHHIELICYCPACLGSTISKKKAAASRSNGKLGGRPKGSKNKPKAKTETKASATTKSKTTAKRGTR